MRINRRGKIPSRITLVKSLSVLLLTTTILLPSSEANIVEVPIDTYVETTVPQELEILLRDCQELEEMNRNTTSVEKQISARIILLKEELRKFIEQSLDIPVVLDGELLTYEVISKERKYIDEEIEITDPNWSKEIGMQVEDGISFYYYTSRTIYQLDVDEEALMTLIRFINLKKTPTPQEILEVLKCYEEAKETSYGYRTAYLTCIDEKAEIGKNRETTVYTGTIFNNTQYSKRTTDLIQKIYLKVKTDYVNRTKSTYTASEYVLECIEGRWLIIHEVTGATDLLSSDESNLCNAARAVENCLDENGILANEKQVDMRIETLQYTLEDYLTKKSEKQK